MHLHAPIFPPPPLPLYPKLSPPHRSSSQEPLTSGSLDDCSSSLIFSPKLLVDGVFVALCLFKCSHSRSLRRHSPLLVSGSCGLICYRTNCTSFNVGMSPYFPPSFSPRTQNLSPGFGRVTYGPAPTQSYSGPGFRNACQTKLMALSSKFIPSLS